MCSGFGDQPHGNYHHHLEIKQLCVKCLISFSQSNPLNQSLLFAELPLFIELMELGMPGIVQLFNAIFQDNVRCVFDSSDSLRGVSKCRCICATKYHLGY